MKSRVMVAASTGLILSVLIAVPVLADDATASTTNNQTQTTQTDSQKRIAKREAALKIKLTTIEQKRLQLRCKSAQGTIRSLQAKASTLGTSRTQLYSDLVTKLNTLQAKLDSKKADTTDLKSEITSLQTKIDSFKADITTYTEAVSDLSSMDCVADPNGFKASLEEARSDLIKTRTDAVGIRSYVTDTIRPTLAKIRASLDTTASTTGGN